MTVTETAPHRAQFRPEPAPPVASPTLVLFFGTLALWGLTLWATLAGDLPTGVTIAADAVVTFLMFTVVHEATHHAVGRSSRLNEVMGRASMLFFAGYAGFGLFRFVHIEHHRNTNEDSNADPDAWAKAGPAWALPLRWATLDIRYAYLWFRRRRPPGERVETVALLSALVAGIVVTSLTGTFWTFAVVYLIPQRIGLIVLAWWFDWLPHHGLDKTQRQDRYKATRIRAGWEPVLTTLLVYQNYHLVHHLHPSVPFYRYIKTWRAGLANYLAHDPPIITPWGRDLTVDEYCAWQGIAERLAAPEDRPRSRSHHLTVSKIAHLTDDAVAVTLAVPAELADTFAFSAGQHVTVSAQHAGIDGRRTYSLCSTPPVSEPVSSLRIGIKQLDGGRFSTWAATTLAAGDTLEVTPPTGRFAPTVASGAADRYVMVAAGSGITPILSVVTRLLEIQADSRCTLLYGNRSKHTTMFADEIAELTEHHPDRLVVHHFLTDAGIEETDRVHAGRIDAGLMAGVLAEEDIAADDVDHWLVCGPQQLIDDLITGLGNAGVADDRIHRELFHVSARDRRTPASRPDVTATITVTHAGGQVTFDLDSNSESILDAGLRELPELPYSCIAGACGTCRARLRSGTVEMETDAALSPHERDAGYVLTCQSHPTSETVILTYDE